MIDIIREREKQQRYFNDIVSKELIKTVEDKNMSGWSSYFSPAAWKEYIISSLYTPDEPIQDTPTEEYTGPTDPEDMITNPIVLETYKKIERVL